MERPLRRTTCCVALLVAAISIACGGDPATANPGAPPASAASPSAEPVYNARWPMDGVLSGGQPTPEQIEALAREGYRTVINIRTAGEPGFEWEKDLVESLGMTYVHIPVGGPETLTRETIGAIDVALRDGRARGPVLYHCASGNRIGATLALRAAWVEGVAPQDAWRYGLDSGMTRLAEPTRGLLGLPPDPSAR